MGRLFTLINILGTKVNEVGMLHKESYDSQSLQPFICLQLRIFCSLMHLLELVIHTQTPHLICLPMVIRELVMILASFKLTVSLDPLVDEWGGYDFAQRKTH